MRRNGVNSAVAFRLWSHRHRTLMLVLTLIMLAVLLTAQSVLPHKLRRPSEIAWQQYRSGNYLAPLVELRRLEEQYLTSPMKNEFLDTIGIYSSYVGNYQEALRYFDQLQPASTPVALESSEFDECQPHAALSMLAEVAHAHPVIFINEAHHVPQHRAFSILLLKVLYDRGFRYFAAETLSEADKQLNQRGYPLFLQTGFYTNEPVYGDLVRTALQLGYTIVPYEATEVASPEQSSDPIQSINERERVQAQNLRDRILQNDPNAKILVHAGYGHIAETASLMEFGQQTGEFIPMAARFKAMTGIDPLTIDQVTMTEHSAPEYENAHYRHAIERSLIEEPTIFQCNGDFWVQESFRGHYDIQLFHPRSRYERGRPTWLRLGGARQPYLLSEGICQEALPCLVQAIAADEDPLAVPMDQVEIRSPGELPALMLPEGEFIVRVRDATGKIIGDFRVRVGGQ